MKVVCTHPYTPYLPLSLPKRHFPISRSLSLKICIWKKVKRHHYWPVAVYPSNTGVRKTDRQTYGKSISTLIILKKFCNVENSLDSERESNKLYLEDINNELMDHKDEWASWLSKAILTWQKTNKQQQKNRCFYEFLKVGHDS